jgi:hypothetical protein
VHPVPRLARPVPAVAAALCALVVLAGCGDALAKRPPFPRTTIQANAGQPTGSTGTPTGTAAGKPVEPAFAADKLRLIDPCKLLDNQVLKELGTPDAPLGGGFSRCSNFMKDKAGKDLAITVEVGQTMTSEVQKADKRIAGLHSYESVLEGSACFVNVITQESPGLAVTVQIGFKDGDGCPAGRKVAESAVKLIRANSAAKAPEKGSIVGLDPCELPSDAAIVEASSQSPRKSPYGLHSCSWTGTEAEVSLDLRGGYVPKDNKFDPKQTEVDLGGVKAYQVDSSGSYPSCTLKWVHRKSTADEGELVEVKSTGPKKAEFDRCARAQSFAKSLLPKLPKP